MNFNRHLVKNSKYGHYSKVTHPIDHEKFPLFTKAVSTDIELKAGEYMYIPGKCWHWIVSQGRCVSVNFWFENSTLGDVPFCRPFKTDVLWSDEYIANICKDKPIAIWATKPDLIKHMNFQTFVNDGHKEQCYFNTVSGYEFIPTNKFVLDALMPEIKRIQMSVNAPRDAVPNFWMNYGNVDSGLHYDDYSGILCLLEGTKQIKLYDANQSEYLYPHRIS